MSVLLLSTALISAAESSLTYQLEQNTERSDVVTVSVDTKQLGTFNIQPARTLADGTQPTLACVTASGSRSDIKYQTDIQCDHVDWQLPLAKIGHDGFDIADQVDSYSPDKGWRFISEFNSLPRFSKHSDEPIPAQVCAPNNQCSWMPDESQPPLFMILSLIHISEPTRR